MSGGRPHLGGSKRLSGRGPWGVPGGGEPVCARLTLRRSLPRPWRLALLAIVDVWPDVFYPPNGFGRRRMLSDILRGQVSANLDLPGTCALHKTR